MFTAADVERLVGPVMYDRGDEYARTGQVVSVARQRDGDTIVGHVRGSGRQQYVCVVRLDADGALTSSSCSCPVGEDCKHVAAALLVHLDRRALDRRAGGAEPTADGAAPASGPPLGDGGAGGARTDGADRGSPARPGRGSAGSGGATSSGPSPASGWEAELASLFPAPISRDARPAGAGAARGRARSATAEIALQVELGVQTTPRARRLPGDPVRDRADGPRCLNLRPVVRGASGRWVRTGISWSELRYARGGFDPVHVEILRTLYALASSAASSSFYFDAPTWVDASTIPPTALWAVLGDARRRGLPVVESDRAQSPVEIVAGPVASELLLERAQDGGLGLGVALHVEGRPLEAREMLAIGTPPGGFVRRRGTALDGTGPLQLLALEVPLDETAARLLARPGSLHVPAADVRRFLLDVLPVLRERFGATSVDARIEVPARPAPRLFLQVVRLPDHVTHLDWQWRYAVWDDVADAGPSGTGTGTGTASGADPVLVAGLGDHVDRLRDATAEAEILERLAGRVPRLLRALQAGADQGGSTAAHAELSGMTTARFFAEELATIEEVAASDPDLGIDEVGADGSVDYRRASGVEITVEVMPAEGGRDWFDLGVIVHAENRQIPFALVFTALAKGQSRLLLDDGLWFELDDERFDRLRELIAEARVLQDTMGSTIRVNRYHAGLFEELEEMGVLGGQEAAWRAAIGGLAGGARPGPVPAPDGLRATMRPYQHEGYEWLEFLRSNGLGGVLADDMGLGKTIQALAMMQRAREASGSAQPTEGGTEGGTAADGTAADGTASAVEPAVPRPAPFLVVAPTSVVENWVTETARFTPGLTAVALRETRARRRTPLAEAIAGADVVVTSYAIFRLDFEDFSAQRWQGLVLDEAQFVKNHQSVAYQCARRLETPFKLAMTGTPLENNLLELWSLVSIVCPGLFPMPARFTDYYARPIEKENNQQRLDLLRRRIAPFMLRRTKETVVKELPAKQEQVADVTLNPRHRKVYDQYLQRERTNVLGLVDRLDDHRFEVFRSLSVLRQAALDVSLVDEAQAAIPSSKLEALFDMLDDIVAEGHSVLVFSQFTQFLGKVRDELGRRGIEHAYLDGRTRKRAEAIASFTSGKVPVFLISLKAGGFGLNLTAADYCILLDPWWNPAAEAQAVDRAHRIGQKRKVMVYRLVSTNTIEEKVMALKASKSRLFSSVIDGGAAGGGGLTAEDVRNLLA